MNTSKIGFSRDLLKGKIALVTGAGRGNGAAIAAALGAAGAGVWVTDLDEAAARATARALSEQGIRAWAAALDVTNQEECAALALQIDSVSDASILVNNAGIIIRETSEAPDAHENFRRTMNVNLNGALNVTLALLPALKNARRHCKYRLAHRVYRPCRRRLRSVQGGGAAAYPLACP